MTRNTDNTIGAAEWRLLELLTVGVEEGGAGLDEFREILAGRLSWPDLVEGAMRHHQLPLLVERLYSLGLDEFIPVPLRQDLQRSLIANRQVVRVLGEHAFSLAEALKAEGATIAFTKGVTFDSLLYDGRGVRTFGDIDTMTAPGNKEALLRALARLGYTSSVRFDLNREALVPLDRRRELLYRTSPDHIPPHGQIHESTGMPIMVDVAFSLTWWQSPWQIPIERALESTYTLETPAGGIPTLGLEYSFLFTCLHLFRESWFERGINLGKDMLYKFGDLLRLWKLCLEHERIDVLRSIVERDGVEEPVLWVLEHMDRTFGTSVVTDLGLDAHCDEDWLASASGVSGARLSWSGDMRIRLQARHPSMFLDA